jgi:hypothetical protein
MTHTYRTTQIHLLSPAPRAKSVSCTVSISRALTVQNPCTSAKSFSESATSFSELHDASASLDCLEAMRAQTGVIRLLPARARAFNFASSTRGLSYAERAIVRRARQIIHARRSWTKLRLAEDKHGDSCSYDDRKAVRFCAVGALRRAALEVTGDPRRAETLASEAANKLSHDNGATIMTINDVDGHVAVLNVFDRALAQHPRSPLALDNELPRRLERTT